MAAHKNDRYVGPQLADLTRKRGAGEIRHRFIGQYEIEALRFGPKSLQGRTARAKAYGLIAELGEQLLRECNQLRLIIDDHHRLTAAARHLACFLDDGLCGIAGDWQPDREPGPFSCDRRNVNRAAKVGNDAMHDGQAEAGAFTDRLGGKEWIEHSLEHFGWNTSARVAYDQADIRPRR